MRDRPSKVINISGIEIRESDKDTIEISYIPDQTQILYAGHEYKIILKVEEEKEDKT